MYLWLQGTTNLYGEFITETEVTDFLRRNGWSEKTNLSVKAWTLTLNGNAYVVTICRTISTPKSFLNKDLLPKGTPPQEPTVAEKFFQDHFQTV